MICPCDPIHAISLYEETTVHDNTWFDSPASGKYIILKRSGNLTNLVVGKSQKFYNPILTNPKANRFEDIPETLILG